jgi:hypothetical protein
MHRLVGLVERAYVGKADGEPYAFLIRGDDNQAYFAHLGDIEQNEIKLYKNLDVPTQFLQEGDRVGFNCFEPVYLLAIHVKKDDLS